MAKKYKMAKGGKHHVAVISQHPKKKKYKAAEGIVNQSVPGQGQQQPAQPQGGGDQGQGQQDQAPMIIVQAVLAFQGQQQPLGGPMQLKSKEDIPKVAQMLEQAFAQVEKAMQGGGQGGGQQQQQAPAQ